MDELEHLSIMHEMCVLELQQLMDNIIVFESKSSEALSGMAQNWRDVIEKENPKSLKVYDKFCSGISEITNLARKFNLHFRLNSWGIDESAALTQPYCIEQYWTAFQSNTVPLDQNSKKETNYAQKGIPPVEESNSYAAKAMSTLKNAAFNEPYYTEQYWPALQSNTVTIEKNSKNEKKCVKKRVLPIKETNTNAVKVAHTSKYATGRNAKKVSKTPKAIKTDALKYSDIDGYRSFPTSCVRKDLTEYSKDSYFIGTVTDIQNLELGRFFVCDVNGEEAKEIANLSRMKHLVQYAKPHLPAEDEIFGLVLDNVILRAVRTDSSKTKLKMQALLLDLGEVVCFNSDSIMYHLSWRLKKIPAQAIFCVLSSEANTDKSELPSLLKSWKYQKMKLKVLKNDGKSLCVKSLLETIEVELFKKIDYTQLAPTNPFREDLLREFMEENGHVDENDEKSLVTQPSSWASAISDSGFGSNELTSEELEILYDETPCTSNPMKAVMGYDPKDELRICRFYNPKKQSCFKGSSCRQEHSLLLKDGWTKDVLPAATIVDGKVPDVLYSAGSIIRVTPTYIGDLDRFYCQINDDSLFNEPIIFTDDDIKNMGGGLQSSPLVFDIVLCRYQDGFWYRAKVMESDDAGKMFKVFYVDYGNHEIVHLKNLAKCNYETAQWPIQAVLCQLADVKTAELTPKKRKEGLKILRTSILNKQIEVKTIFHREELLFRIIDEEYKDLTNKLIDNGYLKSFK